LRGTGAANRTGGSTERKEGWAMYAMHIALLSSRDR
jgi:hypothetical protein